MTALGPRLSLAPAWIRGRPLALRAAASSLALEASSAALDPGLDRLRQLDRDQAAASFREARDSPACPRPRSGAKLLPGLAPTPPGRGRSRGRKRDRGAPRHIERIAARIIVVLLMVWAIILRVAFNTVTSLDKSKTGVCIAIDEPHFR
jgi:hypothetical protein